MLEVSESELLEKATSGDTAALGDLYQRERAIVAGPVRRLLRNEADVEDVLQQTFVNACGAIRKFRGESQISSWFCEIAVNLCLTRLRKERAHPQVTFEGAFPEELVRSAYENPEAGRTRCGDVIDRYSAFRVAENEKDSALVREKHKQVFYAILEELSPEERTVINLVFFDSCVRPSAEEVASIMGFTKRARVYEIIRKFVNRCRELSNEMLGSRNAQPPDDRSP